MRLTIAAIVPCYNGREHVRPVILSLLDVLPTVYVVDDGSVDGSAETLEGLPVEVIRFAQNRGKGHALLAGFRKALERPEVEGVVVVDADGQHDPKEIPRLYAAFRDEHADLVIGSREFARRDVPLRSRFGNEITIRVTALLLGRRVPDTQSGFRLHGRAFLESVLETVSAGRYETEMEILVKAVREGRKVTAVPIRTIYEEGNPTSHFNKFRDSARIWWRLFQASRRYRR